MKFLILDATIRPTLVLLEAEIALVIGFVTSAIFDSNESFVITRIVAIGMDHSAFVNFFPAQQAVPVTPTGCVIG